MVSDFWDVFTTDPGAGFAAIGEGFRDGGAMLANAATFHQIDSLNGYVNGVVEQGGGLYQVANVSMHVGAYALEAAVVVYAWGAVGLPTYGIGFGPGAGSTGSHFIFGATENGVMVWRHAVLPGEWFVINASRSAVAGSTTLTGIPILSSSGVLTLEYGVGNCFITAVYAYGRGWVR